MAKTEVILTHNIVGVGAESDHVKVSAGYARNYLLPQGFAIPVTHANKRRIEVLRQRRAEREAHEYNAMNELAKSITKLTCLMKVKTGDDGKMFGSVTSGMIADELKHQFDITLDKKKIHLDHPIRTLGEQEIELRLHADVKATLKVKLESLTPPPALAETPEAKAGDRGHGPRTEKRGRRPMGKPEAAPAEGEAKTAAPAARGSRPERPTRPPGDRPPRSEGRPPRAEKAPRVEKPQKAE